MSSWSGGRSIRVRKHKPGHYHQTREAGFCSLFLGYFYEWLYAQHANQILYVNSTPNPVGANYELLKETFQNPTGVEFTREKQPDWILVPHGQIKIRLAFYSDLQLQELARSFFRFTPQMLSHLAEFRSQRGLLGSFDIGVHIRTGDKITTGEMAAIPIHEYAEQIRKQCGLPSPRIFVMTDNIEALEQLQAIADPSWTISSYVLERQRGHVQLEFNLSEGAQRKNDYIQFLAEIQTMLEIPSLIVTFTSNIGRYLYLTAPSSTRVTSLDMKTFAPI